MMVPKDILHFLSDKQPSLCVLSILNEPPLMHQLAQVKQRRLSCTHLAGLVSRAWIGDRDIQQQIRPAGVLHV